MRRRITQNEQQTTVSPGMGAGALESDRRASEDDDSAEQSKSVNEREKASDLPRASPARKASQGVIAATKATAGRRPPQTTLIQQNVTKDQNSESKDDDEDEEDASEEDEEEKEQEEEEEDDDTSDESWSEQEESSESEDDDSDEDWSEEEERKRKRTRRGATVSGRGGRQASQSRGGGSARGRTAYQTPVFPPRAVMVSQSNYAFEFDIQSEFNMYTVDVVVGNFVNALEGSCENQGNASSLTWLSEVPPPNYSSGTIIVRPVSMRIPAMAGRWMAGHFISSLGCCGIMFWHTLYVGPNPQAAVDLIKDFAREGMEIIENNEREHLRNKGLRLIGRYSWDYYRQYGGGGYRIPQLASTLFGGPHCFFVPADEYRNKIYPDILTRVSEFDNDAPDARFQPFINRINSNGALGVFPNQEYMFAKVFLQPDSYTNRTRWVGVRAMLLYTYNVGETWGDCRIENIPIDVQSVSLDAVAPT